MERIPVIDLFAGPGGLGEGFSACCIDGAARFRVALSIEKDPAAHATLELRAFFRQFPRGEVPEDYYRHVRDPRGFPRGELFARSPHESSMARQEAWLAELGVTDNAEIDRRVRKALGQADCWVLVGGPPCQAYSLVGRSHRGGLRDDDPRVLLYREHLRIHAVHQPPGTCRYTIRLLNQHAQILDSTPAAQSSRGASERGARPIIAHDDLGHQ